MSDHSIRAATPDDIFLWPDGTRCYRHEHERGHHQQMSDDFEVIPAGSQRWQIIEEEA